MRTVPESTNPNVHMYILCVWALSGTGDNEERACKVQTLNKQRTHITCRESARNKSYQKPNRGYAKRDAPFCNALASRLTV